MENLEKCPITEPLIFDSHAHYDDKKFDGIRHKLLAALPQHGVCGVITCGCDAASSKNALALAEQYPYVYAAVGIHPESLSSNTTIAEIEALSRHEKCVAIGEIGLDYYWESDNKTKQLETFEQQLLLAKRLDLPVIVHDRDAHADTLSLLQKHRPKGVVHCFSGSPEMAAELLKIGMYIGIGGVITFKNAKRLPEVVRMLPDDRLLLETDCPYLAPEPLRGKLCHSAMIGFTAQKVAELRQTNCNSILALARKNTQNLFGI